MTVQTISVTAAKKPINTQATIIDYSNGQLVLTFPYDQNVVAQIKALPYEQRRWDQANKVWRANKELLPNIIAILPNATLTPAARGVQTTVSATPVVITPPVKKPAQVSLSNNQLVISFDYDKALVETIKRLPERKFDMPTKTWIVPAKLIEDVMAIMPPDTVYDPTVITLAKNLKAAAQPAYNIGVDLSQPINGIKLFAHQQEDVARMVSEGSLILAGEVGTGKTYTLLTAAMLLNQWNGWRIIIITKASLKDDIRRSANKLNLDADVYSWAKIPAPPNQPYILIADEAHMAQGGNKTVRGQAFLDLAEHPNCKVCWPATGTPMRNGKPVNLWPLLKAVKSPVSRNKRQYEKEFCDAKATRFTKWDTSGASKLPELHKATAAKMIRRKKIDCLDLPPQILTIRRVELSAEAKKTYETVYAQAEKEYNRRKEEKRASLEKQLAQSPDDKAIESHLNNIDTADALVILGMLRRANSNAKVEEAIELAEEILDQGSSVVISCEFLESAETIYQDLQSYGAELLTGSVTGNEPGQKISKRQAMIDRFQAKQSRVFVMTGSSGGTGVTLTAAQDMVLVDRPTVPDEVVQLHGRLHRITQTGTVNLHWLQAQEIDRKIDENLIGKDNNSGQVIDGKSTGDLAKEIVKEMFG